MTTRKPWSYKGNKNRYLDEYVDWMERGMGIAIVTKQPNGKIIRDVEAWNPDVVLQGVEFVDATRLKKKGPARPVPFEAGVLRPSTDEVKALLYEKKLIGSLSNFIIATASDFLGHRDITGAIPVCDISGKLDNKGLVYYLPAALIPYAKMTTDKYDLRNPHYLCMDEDSMPTFVFWVPKKDWPTERPANERAATPSPEPVVGPSGSTLQVDTKKAEGGKEPEFIVEAFNPEAEEDPLEFLDYYNESTRGHNAIRSKMMLREEDIERVHYETPCLRHPTKEQLAKLPKISEPRPKLPPIADDDPSYVNFRKKLDRRDEVRKAKIFPAPVFTPEYCNHTHANSPKDPLKATITRDLYMQYWRRAKLGEAELEKRSTCCRACGLAWKKTKQSQHQHYERHRQEYNLWLELTNSKSPRLQPPIRANTVAPPSEGVPTIAAFRALEKIIERNEIELLERAQVCRVCDEVLDYLDKDPQKHYAQHVDQRDKIRSMGSESKPRKTKLTVKEMVVAGVGEGLKSASTDSTLPTPESREFERLGADHPLVKRTEELMRKKDAFTSKHGPAGSRPRSVSRPRSTSRPAEDRAGQTQRKRSLTSPPSIHETAGTARSPPSIYETARTAPTIEHESPPKPKSAPPPKKVRIDSKKPIAVPDDIYWNKATGVWVKIGKGKGKTNPKIKSVPVAPGVHKLSGLPPFTKSREATAHEPIEISSDDPSPVWNSDDEAAAEAEANAIAHGTQIEHIDLAEDVSENEGESEDVGEESDDGVDEQEEPMELEYIEIGGETSSESSDSLEGEEIVEEDQGLEDQDDDRDEDEDLEDEDNIVDEDDVVDDKDALEDEDDVQDEDDLVDDHDALEDEDDVQEEDVVVDDDDDEALEDVDDGVDEDEDVCAEEDCEDEALEAEADDMDIDAESEEEVEEPAPSSYVTSPSVKIITGDEPKPKPKSKSAALPTPRPTPARRSRKRRASDAPYVYSDDEIFYDEPSPILPRPKKARKTKDTVYKPTAEEALPTPEPRLSHKKTKKAKPPHVTVTRKTNKGPPTPATATPSPTDRLAAGLAVLDDQKTRKQKRQAKRQARKVALQARKAALAEETTPAPAPKKVKKAPVEEAPAAPAASKKATSVAPKKAAPTTQKKAIPIATKRTAPRFTAAPAEKAYKVAKNKTTPAATKKDVPVAHKKAAPKVPTASKNTTPKAPLTSAPIPAPRKTAPKAPAASVTKKKTAVPRKPAVRDAGQEFLDSLPTIVPPEPKTKVLKKAVKTTGTKKVAASKKTEVGRPQRAAALRKKDYRV